MGVSCDYFQIREVKLALGKGSGVPGEGISFISCFVKITLIYANDIFSLPTTEELFPWDRTMMLLCHFTI